MRSKFLNLLKLSLVLAALPLAAQTNFDTSGDASLTGQYFYRYVAFLIDPSSGNIDESCSVTGVMTFDGKGGYTTSNTQLYDSFGSNGSCSNPTTGTYGVQSNGIALIDNPVFPATLAGTFTAPVVSASSTEDGSNTFGDQYMDFFVAIQASTGGVSTSALSGSYTAGTMDFLNSSLAYARQGYFTFTANNGTIPAFSVAGSASNISASASVTQNMSGGSYSFTGNGTGTLTFNGPSGATPQSQLISGTKALFISADGNYVLGGSTSGTDMIFGFKSSTGASTVASQLNGTYFISGLDATLSSSNQFLDSFYGAINTNGDGNLYWHERFNDVYDEATFDNLFNTSLSQSSNYITIPGNNGNALLIMGSGTQISLNIGVKATTTVPVSSMYINPLGIVNAASFSPITTSYAPGELVSIFGQFSGVATAGISSLPVATTLGGVQVLINGIAAPVFYVSATQITAMIPYEVTGGSATFKVLANGATSNPVTVYLDLSAPGVYTSTQNGIGAGAVLHANYTPVTTASPAQPGETVLLYLNGLGITTPQVADGAAAPATPLSIFTGDLLLFLDDSVGNGVDPAIQFAGLAPGYAGLYQINFTLPTRGLQNGNVFIGIETDQATTEMATIAVSNFPHTATSNVSPLRSHRK